MSRPLVITERLSAGPQGQAERRPHRTPPTNPTAFLAPFANGSSSPQRLDHSEICIRAASWVVIHSEGDNLLPSSVSSIPAQCPRLGHRGCAPTRLPGFQQAPPVLQQFLASDTRWSRRPLDYPSLGPGVGHFKEPCPFAGDGVGTPDLGTGCAPCHWSRCFQAPALSWKQLYGDAHACTSARVSKPGRHTQLLPTA